MSQRSAQGLEVFKRKRRTLDPCDHRFIRERIEKTERIQIREIATTLEKEGIGFNSVQKRSCKPLRGLDTGRPKIFGEYRGSRAVGGPEIGKAGLKIDPARMMIDDEINPAKGLLEVGRLNVNEREACAILVQIFG